MALLALALTAPLGASVNYEVQSFNYAQAAPITSWTPVYAFTNGETPDAYNLGYDTHFMVGVETPTGALIAAGQGFELVSGTGARDMVVLQTSSTGTVQWTWKSGWTGDDVVSACAILGSDLIVVGFSTVGTGASAVAHRTIARLRLDTTLTTGQSRVIWSSTMTTNQHSSYSTVAVAPDGGLLLGGFISKPDASEMQFHSSGVIPAGATALVAKLPASTLTSGPTVADEATAGGWTWTDSSWTTAVTVKAAGTDIVVALHVERTNSVTGVSSYLAGWAKLTSAGALSGSIREYPDQLQATAMAASPTGGYLIAGVGNVNAARGVSVPAYHGRVSRIDADGNLLWNISVTAEGIDLTVIYTVLGRRAECR